MASIKVYLFSILQILFLNEVVGDLEKRGVPGGVTPVSTDDPYIVEMSNVVLNKINENVSEESDKSEIVRITDAKRQIVAGTLVHLTLELKDRSSTKKICNAKVWDRPWLKKTEVTSVDCDAGQRLTKRSFDNDDVYLQLFHDFTQKYNKVYEEKEFKKRAHIFRANLKKIRLLQKTEQGTAKYGPTWFTDLSQKEYKQFLGLNPQLKKVELPLVKAPEVKLPSEFDWRNYNVVTPVKNQESCGSCWAFSVTGNVEGQWALRKGQLLSLSEQELVDCDKTDDGCGGGYMTNAYEAIIKLGGLETETDYPYDARDETCHFNSSEIRVTIDGAFNLTQNETKMAQWLFKNGPISVGVNANAMQFYMGGVSHPWKILCNPEELDHGVLIVGFGVHESRIRKKILPYWIIKNSWGARWGEKGYYRLYRGDDSCGVAQMATSAIVN